MYAFGVGHTVLIIDTTNTYISMRCIERSQGSSLPLDTQLASAITPPFSHAKDWHLDGVRGCISLQVSRSCAVGIGSLQASGRRTYAFVCVGFAFLLRGRLSGGRPYHPTRICFRGSSRRSFPHLKHPAFRRRLCFVMCRALTPRF